METLGTGILITLCLFSPYTALGLTFLLFWVVRVFRLAVNKLIDRKH